MRTVIMKSRNSGRRLNANFTSNLTSGNAPLGVQFTDLSAEGAHTVTASANGYVTYNNNAVVIPPEDSGVADFVIADTFDGPVPLCANLGRTPDRSRFSP